MNQNNCELRDWIQAEGPGSDSRRRNDFGFEALTVVNKKVLY
jgi:hypothetical protein